MIKELIKLANHLDLKGLVKEADYLDRIIKEANPNEDGNMDNLVYLDSFQEDKELKEIRNWAQIEKLAERITDTFYEELIDFIKRRNNLEEINRNITSPFSRFQSHYLHQAIVTLEKEVLEKMDYFKK